MAITLKELERLLGTAKSKDRRNFIENAISSLDSQRIGSASSSMRAQSLIPTLHPTTHASAFSNQKVIVCSYCFKICSILYNMNT